SCYLISSVVAPRGLHSFPTRRSSDLTESMREFSRPRYGVDVLKVEVPVNMKFVEGTKSFGGEKAYTKKEAIDLFHKAANVATKPDRKSTRLNSSHGSISYAVFCLKKK